MGVGGEGDLAVTVSFRIRQSSEPAAASTTTTTTLCAAVVVAAVAAALAAWEAGAVKPGRTAQCVPSYPLALEARD